MADKKLNEFPLADPDPLNTIPQVDPATGDITQVRLFRVMQNFGLYDLQADGPRSFNTELYPFQIGFNQLWTKNYIQLGDLNNEDGLLYEMQMDDLIARLKVNYNNIELTNTQDGPGTYRGLKISNYQVEIGSSFTGQPGVIVSAGSIKFRNVPQHATNNAAKSAGLTVGDVYHTAGTLKIVI